MRKFDVSTIELTTPVGRNFWWGEEGHKIEIDDDKYFLYAALKVPMTISEH